MKKILMRIGLGLVVIAILMFAFAYWTLRQSLPQLNGVAKVQILNPISIERDALGTVTISAKSRGDAYFAQGFLHAQERFFEMDLMRRSGAGELAELFGEAALKNDQAHRVHRLRARLVKAYPKLPATHRALLENYTAGVNAGLKSLGTKPWAYRLLSAPVRDWQPVDSLLVVAAMMFNLQDHTNSIEIVNDLAKRSYSDAAYRYFFNRLSQQWDAPLMEDSFGLLKDPAVPTAAEFNVRELSITPTPLTAIPGDFEQQLGSNNWAVMGALTETGSAMLANDMHLNVGVPSIWFRQQLRYSLDIDGVETMWRVNGVSLPGAPGTVVGSNGYVAWGNTNSYGDWMDLVRLKAIAGQADQYQTAAGSGAISNVQEIIKVKSGADVTLSIRESRYGPIIGKDPDGLELALAWVAHRDGGINLGVIDFEVSRSVRELIQHANRAGMPQNNVVSADKSGNVAWTIGGQIPLRAHNLDMQLPVGSEQLPGDVWSGFVDASGLTPPNIQNPSNYRIYTANSRVVNAAGLAYIGNGGYALGARQGRIRDMLNMHASRFAERDMLAMQLDDQASLLNPWWQILKQTTANKPRYAGLETILSNWQARAEPSSVSYRIVRAFRQEIIAEALHAYAAPIRALKPDFVANTSQSEAIVLPILISEAPHLLPPPYMNYSDFKIAALDRALARIIGQSTPVDTKLRFAPVQITDAQITQSELARHPWGEYNIAKVQHPLGRAIPALSWLLDMPNDAMLGDTGHVVRAQGPGFGASQRLVVSPGHEDKAIFHMPGGQSGHPLSPFYGSGHQDWVNGNPTPLLPGKSVHTLMLLPND
jgi:penicillin G amidase